MKHPSTYLYRIGKYPNNECAYCGEIDDPPDLMIQTMIATEDGMNHSAAFLTEVLKEKDEKT